MIELRYAGRTISYDDAKDFVNQFRAEIKSTLFSYAYYEHRERYFLLDDDDEEMPEDIARSFFSSTANYNSYTTNPWKITDDTGSEDFEECYKWL